VALHRSQEMESMPVPLALRHDVMPPHRSKELPGLLVHAARPDGVALRSS